MQEEWRDIKGYEGLYQVSNLGQVRSLDKIDRRGRFRKSRIIRSRFNNSGYRVIHLSKSGTQKTYLVHRLVAESFIPNPENKPQVNHLDENKSNNNLKNLNWMSSSENINYGERTRKAILNSKRKPVVCFNKQGERTEFNSIQEASRILGLYASNICYCLKGRLKTTGGYKFEYK